MHTKCNKKLITVTNIIATIKDVTTKFNIVVNVRKFLRNKFKTEWMKVAV